MSKQLSAIFAIGSFAIGYFCAAIAWALGSDHYFVIGWNAALICFTTFTLLTVATFPLIRAVDRLSDQQRRKPGFFGGRGY